MITAKVICSNKQEYPATESGGRQAAVTFLPDYQDGRNKEWASATPSLNLQMTLNDQAADLFETGKRYTLQFVEEAN